MDRDIRCRDRFSLADTIGFARGRTSEDRFGLLRSRRSGCTDMTRRWLGIGAVLLAACTADAIGGTSTSFGSGASASASSVGDDGDSSGDSDSGDTGDNGASTSAATGTSGGATTGGAAMCGDGVAEGAEACDGTDLAGQTCASLGEASGMLSCLADCSDFDTSGCGGAAPMCGNGQIEGLEQCDGAQLGGQSCMSQGYDTGVLTCDASCMFDDSGCSSMACANQFESCAMLPCCAGLFCYPFEDNICGPRP
jgi:hypothetical protein